MAACPPPASFAADSRSPFPVRLILHDEPVKFPVEDTIFLSFGEALTLAAELREAIAAAEKAGHGRRNPVPDPESEG